MTAARKPLIYLDQCRPAAPGSISDWRAVARVYGVCDAMLDACSTANGIGEWLALLDSITR